MTTIDVLEFEQMKKNIPPFKVGDTVKVHVRVIEGNRSRIQVFQGVVIRRQGGGMTFRVQIGYFATREDAPPAR